ncbi:MAG: hypothetical protein JWR80_8258 [Bradyrhizobium sp.]|nr:hypothetical protein [Bradyrhizobium sp.]
MSITRKAMPLLLLGCLGGVGALLAGCGGKKGEDSAPGGPSIGHFDIGGTVRSAAGPEAGVWVIAETNDLPTPYRKIVVTDNAGRFLVPGLPKAHYHLWVRGYGLIDSARTDANPGDQIALTAKLAPDAISAAQVYPANYWLSLLKPPPASSFPVQGLRRLDRLGGSSPLLLDVAANQTEFMHELTICSGCHQVGTKATRDLNPALGTFASVEEAWDHRIKSGPMASLMSRVFSRFPRPLAVKAFADWTSRIQQGAVPQAPPRPQGIERNVVLTEWDWGNGPSDWVHDENSTDKRNPTINANGPIYGAANGSGTLAILDPLTGTVQAKKVPLLVPEKEMRDPAIGGPDVDRSLTPVPSATWGANPVWTAKSIPHNPMIDSYGKVWLTARLRQVARNPAFCTNPNNPFARALPLAESERQVTIYDPKTARWTLIDTCFSTHHLQFASDKDNTLYFSGTDGAVGWLNTRLFYETGNAQAAQGWCATYTDVDADGHENRNLHRRLKTRAYGIAVSPADGSVWYAAAGLPGHIVRFTRGAGAPATCHSEVYEPPFWKGISPTQLGYAPKGLDVGPDGVVWMSLHSGHLASFDRRKCPPTQATGQGCAIGWKLYRAPGPTIGDTATSADRLYYNWSDTGNTLGLGNNVQIGTGSNSDSLLVLPEDRAKFLVFRVPYPLGFMPRGMDGRIDDRTAGWKGRGVWATNGAIALWHSERKMKTRPMVVRFQVRPNPLAN